MTIRIVTDSTCDLPRDLVEEYKIGVVPLYINVGKQGYLDGIDITREAFYQQLPDFPVHPTTAVPSPQKFRAMYDAFADEGASEILSIHISASLSAVANVARVAAQEFNAVPVQVLDSRQLSLGTGFLVETAAKLAAAGHSMNEILVELESQIKRSHVFAALNTLQYLQRSGRMNAFMSNLGTLLQIKPIMTMFDGKPGSEKVRTSDRAMKRVVEMLEQVGKIARVAIVHTHAQERVNELCERAAHLLPSQEPLAVDITPVIGAHIGPGAVGFAVVGAKE
jgi:DegV family protein with EDD domain